MTDQVPDVVGVGRLTLDQVGVGPGVEDPDMILTTSSIQAGGPTGTALATMAALGARVLLGVRKVGQGLGELLDLADVVIVSERVAAEIAHSADMERSLVELVKMGPETAVITLGDEGAIGLHEEKLVRQQAIDVEMVDITGAGSIFRGA